jgi:hypothetical protein
MRKSLICVIAIMAAMAIRSGYWQSSAKEAVSFTEDNELYVEAGDFDVYFELLEPFSETYMVFGFQHMDYKNSFNNFSLSGIPLEEVQPIYDEHPDFYMCKSPGAARAQKLTRSMNIISADSSVMDALHEAVSAHENSFGRDGDRVAVILEGVKLEMTAAIVRDADEDMLERLPKGSRENYFLVESVEIIDAIAALEES